MTLVRYHPAANPEQSTGCLSIRTQGKLILSLPSQRGCATLCSFCGSRPGDGVRNLSSEAILQLAQQAYSELPKVQDEVELSFTGEGEPLVNWKNLATALCQFDAGDATVTGRLSLSGYHADRLLQSYRPPLRSVRLQVSLHAARQVVRDSLIPRSISLAALRAEVLRHESKFTGVEVNVVLQNGVNDSDEDLAALMDWVPERWPVLLNPLLGDGTASLGSRAPVFEEKLRSAGNSVRVYQEVARQLAVQRIYPLLATRS